MTNMLFISQDKSHKLKLKSPVTEIPNSSSYIEGLAKDILHSAPINKKKKRPKCLTTERKTKIVGASKFTAKHRKSVFSVRGILKNRPKVLLGKNSTACKLHDANLGIKFGTPQSGRHVSFSGKVDILGPKRKSLPSLECPTLQNICSSYSDSGTTSLVRNHSAETGKNLASVQVNEFDDNVSFGTENETKVHSVTQSQSSDLHLGFDKPDFLRHHISFQEQFLNRSLNRNQVAPGNASPNLFEPRFLSTPKVGYCPNTSQVGGNSFPQPSSSCFSNADRNAYGSVPFALGNTAENYVGQALQYQPFRHMSPKELMCSICSFPDLNRRGITREGKSSVGEEFVGLPLNSHGELIQLNLNDRYGFNPLMSPSTVSNSSSNFAPQTNKLPHSYGDYSILDNFDAIENPNFFASSRMGISEVQGIGRKDVPFLDYLRENNRSVYMQYGPSWNHPGNRKMHNPQGNYSDPVTQPTMRLMGKEFTVGRNETDFLGLEDGNIWMDKQIIAEHRHANDSIANSSLMTKFQPDIVVHPTAGKGKETAASSPEIQINQSSVLYQNDRFALDGTLISGSRPYYPPPPLFHRAPIFQDPFVFGYGSPRVNSQMQIRASTPHSTLQNLNSVFSQCTNKQKLPLPSNSGFRFPFKQSGCQSSSTNLHPWLSNATQQNQISVGSFQSYSDVDGSHHPCAMSANEFRIIPSTCCPPDISYPYDPLSIHSTTTQSSSVSHPRFVPVRPRFIQTSTVSNRHEYRMKFKERMKSRVCLKDQTTKKRPATNSNCSKKPSKIPNLETQHHSNCGVIASLASGGFELDSAHYTGNNAMECDKIATQMEELRVYAATDPSNPGPIRLTAGAKHILQPSQNADQRNPTPGQLIQQFPVLH